MDHAYNAYNMGMENLLLLTCSTSTITLLPNEMIALDGKSVKVDGETIRFKMWKGVRLYVNCRKWTFGYFELVNFDLSWGNPLVAVMNWSNGKQDAVPNAVCQLLDIESSRLINFNKE